MNEQRDIVILGGGGSVGGVGEGAAVAAEEVHECSRACCNASGGCQFTPNTWWGVVVHVWNVTTLAFLLRWRSRSYKYLL